jgi:hypothetical protein
MTDPWDTPSDLHSEQGGPKGEHPGRAHNPVVSVHDLAWLQFEKPVEAVVDTFTFPSKLEIQP